MHSLSFHLKGIHEALLLRIKDENVEEEECGVRELIFILHLLCARKFIYVVFQGT